MIRLLTIEFRKNITYTAFWVILGLHYFFLISFILNINDLSGSFNFSSSDLPQPLDLSGFNIFAFPDLWQNLAYLASFFKILPGIFIAIAVTNEFQYNTIRMNLTNGMTRMEFILTKYLLSIVISLVSLVILLVLGLFIGMIRNTPDPDISVLYGSEFLIAYFVELIFYFSLAVFFAVWLKRTGISIFMLLIYPLLVEPVVRWQIPDHIDKYFPVKAMDQLNAFPFQKYVGMEVSATIPTDCLIATLLWTGLLFLFSLIMLKRRNV